MHIFSMVLLDDAFEANDLVTEVFRKYHQLIIKNRPKYANSCLISTQSSTNGSAGNSSQNGTGAARNTMDELHEIFASTSNSNASHSNGKPIMASLTPLEPTLATVKVKTNGN